MNLRKPTLALIASTVAFGVMAPAVASAQYYPAPVSSPDGRAYDQRGGYYYDGCRRAQSNRAVGGGLAGAAAGAVIGGNVASRKNKDEGAILGGLLGAVVGSQIGKSTAACASNTNTASRQYGYDYGNSAPPLPPVYAPPPPPVVYEDRRYDDRSYDDRRYADGYGYADQRAYDYDTTRRADECRMIESRVRMPDGRTQKRMVQACRDESGEYQLVD